MIVIYSSKKIVDRKNDKVKFINIPKTNEEYLSMTFGCIKFFESFRFLLINIDPLVGTID